MSSKTVGLSVRVSLLAAASFSCAAIAQSQAMQVTAPVQPLGAALRLIARQTKSEIIFSDAEIGAKQSKAVFGKFATENAFQAAIAGSELAVRRTAQGQFVVVSAHQSGEGIGAVERPEAPASDIVVTGTRFTGLRASDSAAPIQSVDSSTFKRVGQPDLIQGLAQTVPSLTAEAAGADTAALTLTARLRGLSPNDTLVLVNGKRRHTSANLHVLGGPYQGAAAADLGLIPVDMIDHVEVLQDGAAAQYGTDAIAGVVNVILKRNRTGGQISATGGQYYAGDGKTASVSGNVGLALGDRGFLSLTAEGRLHQHSVLGGIDSRISNVDGSLLATTPAAFAQIPGYPYLNKVTGDAKTRLALVAFNGEYDLGGVKFYSSGTYGYRRAEAYENYRLPNRIVASPVFGVAGTYGTPGAIVFAPQGFYPKEGLRETDFATTGGLTGDLGTDWHWDLATTYGRNKNTISTLDSANASLFIETHNTPTNFYDGAFIASQWTTNLDLTGTFDVGLPKPVNVAIGGEYRRDGYKIKAGDAASIYKEGAQSFPGFQPTDAGSHNRSNVAAYVDIGLTPVNGLALDAAGRYEHYSDFGSTVVGKLTARYDFSPAIAIRGTVANGFRAPTLAEEYYSSTNVAPSFAVVQLPPNSAAAHVLGFSNLKSERSTNLSAGLVLHPASHFTFTADAYQIRIRDRIIGSGTFVGQSGSTIISQQVLNAIAAHGNVLDPQVTFVGASVFLNGVDTRTRGVELTAIYNSNLGNAGRIDWSLAANYNQTKATKFAPPPVRVAALGAIISPSSLSDLETASPKFKVIGSMLWTKGRLSVNVRESLYGKSVEIVSPDGSGNPPAYESRIGTAAITDIDIAFRLTNDLRAAIGANNLFNKKPPNIIQFAPNGGRADGGAGYNEPPLFSPYGINGGYYYAKLTFNF